jgi:hypothetical protein
MEWNEGQQKWLMKLKRNEAMIQEFFDCENVRKYFNGLNKSIPSTYKINISKLENSVQDSVENNNQLCINFK